MQSPLNVWQPIPVHTRPMNMETVRYIDHCYITFILYYYDIIITIMDILYLGI